MKKILFLLLILICFTVNISNADKDYLVTEEDNLSIIEHFPSKHIIIRFQDKGETVTIYLSPKCKALENFTNKEYDFSEALEKAAEKTNIKFKDEIILLLEYMEFLKNCLPRMGLRKFNQYQDDCHRRLMEILKGEE